MCFGKWGWGLFLIILGGAWIASNLGMIQINFWDYWPLIFILMGIGIITAKPPKPFIAECCNWNNMDWGDMDDDEVRNEIAKSIENVSKKISKKIKKGSNKKK